MALIYDEANFPSALAHADELRKEYDVTLFEAPKKLGKLFARLEESGYAGCIVEGKDEIKMFGETK